MLKIFNREDIILFKRLFKTSEIKDRGLFLIVYLRTS